nr:MAG TPA: hypothetical protein [Caudoviricetes sp.]
MFSSSCSLLFFITWCPDYIERHSETIQTTCC